MGNYRDLQVPEHFRPEKVGEVWRVAYQQRAAEASAWASRMKIPSASADNFRVGLLLIDVQNTFCIPGFELFVGGRSGRGAIEDNQRLCSFIYRNLSSITGICPTLDTHSSLQIFHPVFWVDSEGNHPKPGQTMISPEDVEKGAWKVNPMVASCLCPKDPGRLQRFALHYVRKLSEGGKFPLMIWPYHAMLGGIGHSLVSSIEEALFFHSIARSAETHFELKGEEPLTENYSALAPEVDLDETGKSLGLRNQELVSRLLEFDAVVIAGQAKSHCVANTIEDFLGEIKKRDSKMAEKVYLLGDCTSPVVVPGVIDFTDSADRAYKRFAEAGMHLVESTTPIAEWPGVFRK